MTAAMEPRNKNRMGTLRRRLRPHIAILSVIAGLSGLTCLLTMGLTAFTNGLAANGVENVRLAVAREGMMVLALVMTTTVSQVLVTRFGGKIVEQLRVDLAVKFLLVDYEKVINRNQSILSAMIQDVERIGVLALTGPQFVSNLLLVIVFSAYLIHVSPALYLVFALFILPGAAGQFWIDRLTRPKFDTMRRAEDIVNEHLGEIASAKREFCLNRPRSDHFVDRHLRPSIAHARTLRNRLHLIWSIFDSWSNIILNCAIFATVLVAYTAQGLSSAVVVQFVLGCLFIIRPINFFAGIAHAIGVGLASLRNLMRLGLDLETEVSRAPRLRHATKSRGRDWQTVQADGVVYRYARVAANEPEQGVGPITLTIRRGEMLFVVGGNGSGKSTLLMLLCGLLRPKHGTIRVDGRIVQDDLDGYRSMFCGTLSGCFVFRNVLDGFGNVKSDGVVREYLQRYGLAEEVRVEHGELSTINLSTGQRKRLALIHCLAQDGDIYFFDEWAAEQDPALRDTFYRKLLPDLKRRGKTVLAITHDDRYFYLADRVVTLDNGLVVSDKSLRDEPGKGVVAEGSA